MRWVLVRKLLYTRHYSNNYSQLYKASKVTQGQSERVRRCVLDRFSEFNYESALILKIFDILAYGGKFFSSKIRFVENSRKNRLDQKIVENLTSSMVF